MAVDLNEEVQKFGPYELVIRPDSTNAVGPKSWHVLLWRSGKVLVHAVDESKEKAYEELLRQLGIRQLESAKNQGNQPLSAEQVAAAFRFLWGQLTVAQKRMLQALRKADHREMTAPELAAVAGFNGYEGANLWLGLAGAMFAIECPRAAAEMLYEKGSPVMTSWFALWDDARRVWTMRDEVAEGMKLAYCA